MRLGVGQMVRIVGGCLIGGTNLQRLLPCSRPSFETGFDPEQTCLSALRMATWVTRDYCESHQLSIEELGLVFIPSPSYPLARIRVSHG